jgi:hypothetical protein
LHSHDDEDDENIDQHEEKDDHHDNGTLENSSFALNANGISDGVDHDESESVACAEFPLRFFMLIYKDLITIESLILALYILPGSFLGTLAGNHLQNKIKKETFQKSVWIILLILGLILGAATAVSLFTENNPSDTENMSWINGK